MIVVKSESFEAAHYLPDYEGACGNIHGHSYKLEVGIEGVVNPDTGMVVDFKKIKEIINSEIISKLDHAYLNQIDEFPVKGFPSHMPTAENMTVWILNTLNKAVLALPNNEITKIENTKGIFKVYKYYVRFVKLWETSDSYSFYEIPFEPFIGSDGYGVNVQ